MTTFTDEIAERSNPSVVALGGGHGLSASLSALRSITDDVTAVVTVGDDGGSSGVLRRDLGVLPPGDLRMAIATLAGEDEQGQLWASVLQHRFDRGDLAGHPVGNLILVALMEELGNPVAALKAMNALVGSTGRVLPMCEEPVEIVAQLAPTRPGVSVGGSPVSAHQVDLESRTVRGQAAVGTAAGDVVSIALDPPDPKPCSAAIEAVLTSEAVVLGPGSWFTSVLPHLLVPSLRAALTATAALRVVTLNLGPQAGETTGFTPENHLEVLAAQAPEFRVDVVVADRSTVHDPHTLTEVANALGAELLLADVMSPTHPHTHDPGGLASAYRQALSRGRIRPWR